MVMIMGRIIAMLIMSVVMTVRVSMIVIMVAIWSVNVDLALWSSWNWNVGLNVNGPARLTDRDNEQIDHRGSRA